MIALYGGEMQPTWRRCRPLFLTRGNILNQHAARRRSACARYAWLSPSSPRFRPWRASRGIRSTARLDYLHIGSPLRSIDARRRPHINSVDGEGANLVIDNDGWRYQIKSVGPHSPYRG